MARDNYYCFMCGRYDTHWFFRQQSKPEGADFNDCGFVRIIKREMFAQDEDSMSARGEVGRSSTTRLWRLTFTPAPPRPLVAGCGFVRHNARHLRALFRRGRGHSGEGGGAPEHAVREHLCVHGVPPVYVVPAPHQGPSHPFFPRSAWPAHDLCLSTIPRRGTAAQTPNRYKIKTYGPQNYAGVRHVTSHVTFVDHSQPSPPAPPSTTTTPSSTSQPQTPAPAPAGVAEPVPLPDPALLRLHAALSGVLCLSGADTTFECLFARPHWLPGFSRWPAARGAAFWASVVEYAGAETCVEVDLQLSVEELCADVLERERALAADKGGGELEEEESGRRWRRRRTRNSRAGSPRRR